MENVYRSGDLQTEVAQMNSLSASSWAMTKKDWQIDQSQKNQPVDLNEGTAAKILREGEVFGKGLTQGIVSGAQEALDDKGGTALRLAASVGTGALMTVMHGRTGMVGLAGRALSVGFGVSFIADVVAPDRINGIGQVWSDTWKSSGNKEQNIELAKQHLGRFAFDNIVMTAGGLAGARGAGHLSEMYPGALTNFGRSVNTAIGDTLRAGMNPGNLHGLTPAYAGAEVRGASMSATRFGEGKNDNVMLSVGGRRDGYRYGGDAKYSGSGAQHESVSDSSSSLVQLFRDTVAKSQKTAHLFNPEPGLPSFSSGTRNILSGGTRPISERVYGKEYSSDGLPTQHDYVPTGFKPIVPYENVGRIIDPVSVQPKSMSSLAEMGEALRAKQRMQLAEGDPVAQGLKAELVGSAAKVKALDQEGVRLNKELDEFVVPHGNRLEGEGRFVVRDYVDKENIVLGLEAKAKEVSALRLESARIGLKLKRMEETGVVPVKAGEPAVDAAVMKKHLLEQQEYLKEEIAERSARIGSVRDPESPIGRAKEELKRARVEVRYFFDLYDRSYVEPSFGERTWNHRDQYMESMTEKFIAAQRAIDTNAAAHKTMAVQFSETAYAYEARLHALQKPVISALEPTAKVTAQTRVGKDFGYGEVPPTDRRAVADYRFRDVPATVAKTEPFNARVEATDLVSNALPQLFREHAIRHMSTSALETPGSIEAAVARMQEQSTVVFFAKGKPLAQANSGETPRMAFVDVKKFNQRLPLIGEAQADGYAVFSPVLQSDGSLTVLRRVPMSVGSGTRAIYSREVLVTGGDVPAGIKPGASMGKVFGIFNNRG